MKKILFLFLSTFIILNANAQLNKSKWKTKFNLDQPVKVVFIFNADTLEVKNLDDNSSLETMKYALKDTTLTIKKLFGQSECDTSVTGSYACKIKGNEMTIKLISDACEHRSGIIRDLKLQKSE